MTDLRAVDEGAVPASTPATSRLFVLPVAACWWVSTDNSVLSSKAGNVQDLAYGEVKGAFICTLYIVFQIFVHSPIKDVQLFVIIGTYRCQSVMEQK